MDIVELANKQWNWCEKVGWHNKDPLEYIALIASEIGEAANECRDDIPTDKLGEELADIILRTLDMAHHYGIDIEYEISRKMEINESRGTRGRTK